MRRHADTVRDAILEIPAGDLVKAPEPLQGRAHPRTVDRIRQPIYLIREGRSSMQRAW